MKANLKIYAEALVPGLIALAAIVALIPSVPTSSKTDPVEWMLTNEIIAGMIFLASAYLLGVVSIVLGRPLIKLTSDPLRRRYLKKKAGNGRTDHDERYRDLIQRTAGSDEVMRRRERVLVIRGAFVPATPGAVAVWETTVGTVVIASLAVYVVVVTLVVLSERGLYDEASRYDKASKKESVDPTNASQAVAPDVQEEPQKIRSSDRLR